MLKIIIKISQFVIKLQYLKSSIDAVYMVFPKKQPFYFFNNSVKW